ncbi:hypothetical protein [Pragia fontium]|uniref:Uncharacterized protein n=2 Tax=Pragia fontium TaxID=82985 RepID=A0AAJ5BG13_9GAMM|nr:hypothetical protein [Pragia fontium]GKX63320.1 hypothetical protein SOASR032_18890 [Pragia fontium]SFC13147.1 hypothetical protein SAMN02745723_101471 [Pragia fontium DSM 5563 = ATCC 49100]SUB81335.1 Uncharacterised protein [Pragia fontium]VEJ53523.1 Uncharacterised protein [Pragia fontium]
MNDEASYRLHNVILALLCGVLGLTSYGLRASAVQGSGDVIINIEKNVPGRYSTTVTRNSGAGSLGASYVTTNLSDKEKLVGLVQGAGQGVCSGRYLTGTGELQGISIPIAMFSQRPYRYEKNYLCGSPVNFASSNGDNVVGFVLGATIDGDSTQIKLAENIDLSKYAGQRILLGNVRLTGDNREIQSNNVYLSFARTLRSDPAVIEASFIKLDAARFSEVAINEDTTKTAMLNVRRISDAPATLLPFTITFESKKGAPNSEFRMYSHEEPGKFIPYTVRFNKRAIGYGELLNYSLGSTNGASELFEINFVIQGKDLVGLKGGTHFSDTFTAVVTPGL